MALVCLGKFRQDTLSATEVLLLSQLPEDVHQMVHRMVNSEDTRYLLDKSLCVWWLDWPEGLFFVSIQPWRLDQGRKTLLEFTHTQLKNSRGDLLKYSYEVI